MSAKKFDQFYTNPLVAQACTREFFDLLPHLDYGGKNLTLLEPSAGAGAFLEAAQQEATSRGINLTLLASDIDPRAPGTWQADFLEDDLRQLWEQDPLRSGDFPSSKGLCILGNPPFGKKADLALKFMRKSLEYGDTVAFVLPLTLRRYLTQKRLPEDWKLVWDSKCPADAFIYEGSAYDVNCCFQVWTRRDNDFTREHDVRQRMKVPTAHPDFTMALHNCTPQTVKYLTQDWGFAVKRQGWGDFAPLKAGTELPERQQWMLFWPHDEATRQRLLSLDYNALADGNTSVRGFGKSDLVAEYMRAHPQRSFEALGYSPQGKPLEQPSAPLEDLQREASKAKVRSGAKAREVVRRGWPRGAGARRERRERSLFDL